MHHPHDRSGVSDYLGLPSRHELGTSNETDVGLVHRVDRRDNRYAGGSAMVYARRPLRPTTDTARVRNSVAPGGKGTTRSGLNLCALVHTAVAESLASTLGTSRIGAIEKVICDSNRLTLLGNRLWGLGLFPDTNRMRHIVCNAQFLHHI
jgi:hypothetical protein